MKFMQRRSAFVMRLAFGSILRRGEVPPLVSVPRPALIAKLFWSLYDNVVFADNCQNKTMLKLCTSLPFTFAAEFQS